MNILIIGGTRFIGPYVVSELISRGHNVTVFHRGNIAVGIQTSVTHLIGDRQNIRSYTRDFERIAPEILIDMVAYTESEAWNTARTFKGIVRRAIVLSSMDVYHAYDNLVGRQHSICPLPLTEQSELRVKLYPYREKAKDPNDFIYDYEKILVERAYANEPEMRATILRLPFVYGPGDYQHRFFEYVKRMTDHRPYILLDKARADWRATRGYVENVAAAITVAATDERASGRVYNVGEDHAFSEKELVTALAQVTGWKGKIITLEDQRLSQLSSNLNWAQDLVADTSRIRQELDFAPPITTQMAFERSVEWQKANPNPGMDLNLFDYSLEEMIVADHQQECMKISEKSSIIP